MYLCMEVVLFSSFGAFFTFMSMSMPTHYYMALEYVQNICSNRVCVRVCEAFFPRRFGIVLLCARCFVVLVAPCERSGSP